MKKSVFNIGINHKGKQYLFNSYTLALAEIESDQFDLYNERQYQNLKDIQSWIDTGFLVKDELDEVRALQVIYNSNKYTPSLAFTIIPTLLCNCACDYCFQDKSKITMSAEIYNILSELVLKEIFRTRDPFNITYYGGEPFLCLEEIKEFTDKITHIAGNNMLNQSFITNGTIFNKEPLDSISAKSKIEMIQVTLDGAKQYHDKVRKYKSGSGTYDTIIANIPLLCKYAPISIRINVDNNSLSTIEELLKDICFLTSISSNISIYFANIRKYNDNVDIDNNRCIDRFQFMDTRIQLASIAQKYGFLVNVYPHCSLGCVYSSQNGFVIDPIGDCFKCWDTVGFDHSNLGNIRNFPAIFCSPEYLRTLGYNPYVDLKCDVCSVLPICRSECPAILAGDTPINEENLSCEEIKRIIMRCVLTRIPPHEQELNKEN